MKRLVILVVGLVFLFTGSVFAADKAAATEEKKDAAVTAPADTKETKEVKKEATKKKVAKKKVAKKAEAKKAEEKKAEEKAPATK